MSVTKVTGMMQTGTKGGDIPSAGTLVIDTDGDYFDVTGTTGITGMTVAAGRIFTLQFDGVVTLTHGSTLYLNGAVNFTTEAFDHLTFIAVAANDVRQIGAGLKDGGSSVAPATTDLTPVRQDIAMLALYNAVSDNRAAYNLPFSFVDQFEDDTGTTTRTDVSNVSEYFATVYTSSGQYASDANTLLLIHSDTTDGSTTFADSSSRSHGVTASGNAQHSTTQYKLGASSIKFDGTTDYLDVSGNQADWQIGTGNYTVDFWFYQESTSDKIIIGNSSTGGASASVWRLKNYTGIKFGSSHADHITHGTAIGLSAWKHIAFVKSGSTCKIFYDGTQSGSDFTGITNDYSENARNLWIGDGHDGGDLHGYLDEIRVSDNVRWTTTFTPNADVSANSATGTLISDTQTAPTATTKMSGVILYKDNEGTATLGTDLVISLSANGGTNYTEAASYGTVTPLFSTGVKMVRLGETTVTSGTTPVIKAVWDNQSSGSKETQLHGWAMNY